MTVPHKAVIEPNKRNWMDKKLVKILEKLFNSGKLLKVIPADGNPRYGCFKKGQSYSFPKGGKPGAWMQDPKVRKNPILCNNGYHFTTRSNLCDWYSSEDEDADRVFLCEVRGVVDLIRWFPYTKGCAKYMRLLRELTPYEIREILRKR